MFSIWGRCVGFSSRSVLHVRVYAPAVPPWVHRHVWEVSIRTVQGLHRHLLQQLSTLSQPALLQLWVVLDHLYSFRRGERCCHVYSLMFFFFSASASWQTPLHWQGLEGPQVSSWCCHDRQNVRPSEEAHTTTVGSTARPAVEPAVPAVWTAVEPAVGS